MRQVRWLAVALTVTAIGLAACGGDNGGEVRTVTVPAEQDAALVGDAILIETRVTDAAHHTGEVLNGSLIGESAFCPGGKTSGGSTGPTILTTFHCPGGRLQIRFSPTQPSLVQSRRRSLRGRAPRRAGFPFGTDAAELLRAEVLS